jgi:uncharacterized protein YjbI with pentapeptide repeats
MKSWMYAHRWATAAFGILGLAILLILFFALFPGLAPDWTGFGYQPHPNGWIMIPYKTLWDWMELLLVPLFIALGAAVLGWRQQQRQLLQQEKDREIAEQGRENEQKIAHEQGQQLELEAYYQNMGTLILQYGLGGKEEAAGVRTLARARTLIALDGLDGGRKGLLLRFLYEAGLINAPDPVIDLFGADLDDLLLRFGDLRGSSLAGATLRDASLIGIDLRGANLNQAHFNRANLRCALLTRATASQTRFSGASLRDANLQETDLGAAVLSLVDAQGLDLRGAVLETAVLDGADLSEALLHGANLGTAVFGPTTYPERPLLLKDARYDAATRWPQGFDPAAAGAMIAEPPPPEAGACAKLAQQYRRDS